MASPGNRPKRGGGQQQGSPSLVSSAKNEAEIRLTNAAQSFLRGEHKSMAEARRVHHCERDDNATFKKTLESWRPFTTRAAAAPASPAASVSVSVAGAAEDDEDDEEEDIATPARLGVEWARLRGD